ncbi:polysaccharide deacetylase family protein [Neiella sp. HB171785]|uniref:Polysaccharide deacetylase family protein n=1 Tax=Neiella litorisoli TaxID=2771431 RepID=A0A8J6R2X5_9GAMM|nr:polysaccharide deacetylase family protein [Neiella litorisoli]MBD1389635.1 polysaccharide deacetylase family protein [Neiella litorisoli]
MIRRFFILVLATYLVPLTASADVGHSAVILQYHHVSETTPPSTSVTPAEFEQHLDWLAENDFEVLPLPTIVSKLRQQQSFSSDKVVAITFDDANVSVCEQAWPILKKRKLPFTLFISTEMIERQYSSQCSWQDLKEMTDSGLMVPANHSHQHSHMIVTAEHGYSYEQWRAEAIKEITTAQNLLEAQLGWSSQLFAYPYGEYNTALAAIVTELGYTGFNQSTGAAGYLSDFAALPRIPVSSQYAALNTLSVKLLSLPFPGDFLPEHPNPIILDSAANPLKVRVKSHAGFEHVLKRTSCFNSSGAPISTTLTANELLISAEQPLKRGRHKYTCTAPSGKDGRWYWGSFQWLISDNGTAVIEPAVH